METWIHCLRSMNAFDESGSEYHYWFDQYWNLDPNDHSHRKVLHHEKGIELGVKRFGERARKHLKLHLEDDTL